MLCPVIAGTETLQLWDWLLATDDSAPGGDVAAADLVEARQMAAAAASSSNAAGALGQVGVFACWPATEVWIWSRASGYVDCSGCSLGGHVACCMSSLRLLHECFSVSTSLVVIYASPLLCIS